MTVSFLRKLTSNRRITIAKETLDKEGIKNGEIVEVWIKKYKPGAT